MMPVEVPDTNKTFGNKFGGNKVLPAHIATDMKTGRKIARTVWLPTKEEIKTMRRGKFGISLVCIDEGDGVPAMSMKILRVELIPG
jgi:hypothetical protein